MEDTKTTNDTPPSSSSPSSHGEDDANTKEVQDQSIADTSPSKNDPKVSRIGVGDSDSAGSSKMDSRKSFIDTRAPISSVKQAASKFGGIAEGKARTQKAVERRKQVEIELEKAQNEIPQLKKRSEEAEESKNRAIKELDTCKRLIEELKLNLERARIEEQQAKQDSDLLKLRFDEMQQGIANELSVAAKSQLEVARARHANAATELQSVKSEFELIRSEFASLLIDKEEAIQNADSAALSEREAEKAAEDLTIELLAAKELLEAAQVAHLEAEELRIAAVMAREQDSHFWEKELRQAEEELKKLHQQVTSSKDLRFKLETASTLLVDLKSELAVYTNSENEQEAVACAQSKLEEVKRNIEKTLSEIDNLKSTSTSLQNDLQKEKIVLVATKQREGMKTFKVSALEAELERTKSEISEIRTKEKEIKEKMLDMPKQLQEAAEQAESAKSRAQKAREDLHAAKQEMELAKAGASTTDTKLSATLKKIESSKASRKIALAAVKALQESESARIINSDIDTPTGITLSLEEYYELSKRAQEAEEEANKRVATAVSQIDVAREMEMRAVEKLEEVNKELAARKEALRAAQEKAEKARERKLGVEQELRKWRSQRNAGDDSGEESGGSGGEDEDGEDGEFVTSPLEHERADGKMDSAHDGKSGKKKNKKSFIPKLFMFMGKKKPHGQHK